LIGPVYPNPEVAPVFEKRIATVEKHGMQPMADAIPGAAVAKNASSLVKAFIRELLLGQSPEGYCSNCRVIANAKPPNYPQIKIPILILAGEEDKSAPLEGCKRMFGEIGTNEKKLEIMPGVGHWHCLEAPDDVVKYIESFYSDMH
jgi:pimeloyl-ACP methyl ester carboxylesterase